MNILSGTRLPLATILALLAAFITPVFVADQAAASGCDPAGTSFGGGTGVDGDPYLVCSAAQLANVGDGTNLSKHYLQTADIDISSYSEWSSIGAPGAFSNPSTRFTGVFDGGNHVIKGLTQTSGNGLFASVVGGHLKNISVEGDVTSTSNAAGLVVGYTQNSRLENLTAFGKLQAGGSGSIFGGVIGHVNNSSSVSETQRLVTNIKASVDVTATSTAEVIGGVIGRFSGPAIVNGVVAEAETRSNGTRGSLTSLVDGVTMRSTSTGIGWASSTSDPVIISNCNISIDASLKEALFGGVVGFADKVEIDNCHFSGSVIQTEISSSTKSRLGGLVGKTNTVLISDSSFSGSIAGFVATSPTSSNSSSYVSGVVSDAFAATTIRRTISSGAVSGYRYTAGFAPSTTSGALLIEESVFSGSATSTDFGAAGFIVQVSTVSVDALVKNSLSVGAVSGNYSVGGFFGSVEVSGTRIQNSYSFSQVNATPGQTQGAISATNTGSADSPGTFWSEIRSGISQSAMGTDLTESQFETLSTFSDAGWDISQDGSSTVWKMGSCAPILSWQTSEPDALCTRPAFESASVISTGDKINLVFTKAINHDGSTDSGLPDKSVFTVSVNGGAAEIASIARATDAENRTIEITLARKVATGDTVTISYTPPTDPAATALENVNTSEEVRAFTNLPVTNSSSAGSRPELITGGLVASLLFFPNQTQLTLLVSSCPVGGNFNPGETISVSVDGEDKTITNSSTSCSPLGGGNGITIEFSPMVFRDQEIIVSYDGDSTGVNAPNSLVSSSGLTYSPGNSFTVLSKSNAKARPVYQSHSLGSESDSIEITFETYTRGIRFSQTPGSSAEESAQALAENITINGAAIEGVPTISGDVLTVPLDRTIYQGDTVSLGYEDPSPEVNDDADGVIELEWRSDTTTTYDAKDFSFTLDTTTAPVQPEVVGATVASDGRSVTIEFDQDISETLPAASVLTVLIDGSAVTLDTLTRTTTLNTLEATFDGVVAAIGSVVSVSYDDPDPIRENPNTEAIGAATGDWDAKSFSVTATNNSTRVLPVADGTVTATETSVTAVASCTSGCGGDPDSVSYTLTQAGNTVATNSTGLFTALTAETDYVVEITVTYQDLASAVVSKPISTLAAPTPPPSNPNPPAPTPPPSDPEPTPEPETEPVPEPEAEPEPTPEEPAPGPAATPQPEDPTPPTAPASDPNSPTPGNPEPETDSPPAGDPTPTPESTPEQPTASPEPEPEAQPEGEENAPTTPKTVTIEEITGGVIQLGNNQDGLILPAVLLEEVVFALAESGAPVNEGTLRIDTQIRSMEVLVIELGNLSFSASEIGDSIEFTLLIPGFEPRSLSVVVEKQTLNVIIWAILAAAVITAGALVWFLFGYRRRKQQTESVRV